jgi:hypothetical protein
MIKKLKWSPGETGMVSLRKPPRPTKSTSSWTSSASHLIWNVRDVFPTTKPTRRLDVFQYA